MKEAMSFSLPPKKSLGQHFLKDKQVIRHIINAAELKADEYVLEIGPGNGCLTEELLKSAKLVIALEIDRNLVTYLQQYLAGFSNLTLIQTDALKYDYNSLFSQHPRFKLVANLPYYIATPLIQRFISVHRLFTFLVLMLPVEVARRITAKPSGKEYGYFSILTQYYYQIETVCKVSAQAFYPQPKVDSLVLKFVPWDDLPVKVSDEDFYWKIVKAAFAQRRKTLINALSKGFVWDDNIAEPKELLLQAMDNAGILPRLRAEVLSVADFAQLADEIQKLVPGSK